ncbi:MAG: DMT family transporter [Gammaproteobacteria bacterium]|nr:DMT family transporter [Gammaproteobacteria bacterium]
MRNSNIQGILLMLAAMASLSLMDGTMKQLSGHYPPLQVAALRGLVSIPFLLAWVWWRERGFTTLVNVRWRWHLMRGALAVIMLTSFIYAISQMPLSETYTLFFIAPLLITALSVPLLGETVEWQRWLAIAIGFGGVLIALRPGFNTIGWSAVAALVGATCYALNVLSVRLLGRTDTSAAMAFWFVVFLAIGAGALAAPGWVPLQAGDAWWLLGMGVTGALGQLLITEAFKRAPASIVAPFEYSSLFWGLLLDLAIFGQLPGMAVWAGAAVVVGSGLYLLRRERIPQPVTPP